MNSIDDYVDSIIISCEEHAYADDYRPTGADEPPIHIDSPAYAKVREDLEALVEDVLKAVKSVTRRPGVSAYLPGPAQVIAELEEQAALEKSKLEREAAEPWHTEEEEIENERRARAREAAEQDSETAEDGDSSD